MYSIIVSIMNFLVVLVRKIKKSIPKPKPATTQSTTTTNTTNTSAPTTNTTDNNNTEQPQDSASTLVTGAKLDEVIANLTNMGFPRDQSMYI